LGRGSTGGTFGGIGSVCPPAYSKAYTQKFKGATLESQPRIDLIHTSMPAAATTKRLNLRPALESHDLAAEHRLLWAWLCRGKPARTLGHHSGALPSLLSALSSLFLYRRADLPSVATPEGDPRGGPKRLRQDDDAQSDRRVSHPRYRRDFFGRALDRRCAAAQAQYRHGVPVLLAVSAHDGRRERALSAAHAHETVARGGERARGRDATRWSRTPASS
jgi:hypothetical protein